MADKKERGISLWHDPMREVMNRFFDENFWAPLTSFEWGVSFPRVDVSETSTSVKVKADIPGIDPKNVDIDVRDDRLTISGRSEEEKEEKDESFYRVERSYGEFNRIISLPARVDPASVKATAKNGVLHITIKKAKPVERKKVKIEVEE